METVTHHNKEQTDGRTVHRVHFLSCTDDSRCDYIDVLACRLNVVDQRTIDADGVMIQFQNDVAEIAAVG